MELFIIAAQTADGFIARNKNEPAMWTSKEDKQRFVALTKDAGVVIMGSTTFKTLPKPLKGRLNIVYSRSMSETDVGLSATDQIEEDRKVEITSVTPHELLTDLQARGYTKAAICGGSEIYSLFIESGLVSQIYLTIEPILFGQGVSIFKNQLLENLRLKLDKYEVTSEGTIFLDYSI
jgi:dihydrofolate reductase